MHDYTRHEQARKLRAEGLSFKEIGEKFGVSAGRARQLIAKLDQKELRAQRIEEANEKPKPWWHGLKKQTVANLEHCGFKSRESCSVFSANDLVIYRRTVDFGEDFEVMGRRFTTKGTKTFPLSQVNEVRGWLGFPPIP
jgi:hypothetical protein